MGRMYRIWPAFLALAMLVVPDLVMAAGGKAEMLIVVADNRVVDWSFAKFWVDAYNTDRSCSACIARSLLVYWAPLWGLSPTRS